MKKFYTSLIAFTFILTGCSFLDFLPKGEEGEKNLSKDTITSFDFVTDSKMVEETLSDGTTKYKVVELYIDETYQVKTDVDDKIGEDYYFTYTIDKENLVDVSSTGLVTAKVKGFASIKTSLYRKKDSKRITYNYFYVRVKEQASEYANITINDSSLVYDALAKTYSLSLKGGDTYAISTSIKYNISYNLVFELSNSVYSSFMTVSTSGILTTQKVTEDKDGQVTIKTTSTDGSKIYDKAYLNVHLQKSDDVVIKELEVTNQATGKKYKDGDNVSLYVNESLTFNVKYGGTSVTNVSSITNSSVLTLENDLNKVTAKAVGESDISFTKEDKSLTLHITVNKNALSEIYSKNGGDDFVIINGNLLYLGRVFAKYSSGTEVDITKSTNLTYKISNLDSNYKSVKFSYTEDGVSKSVTYNVKYFVSEDYQASNTAYNFSDYFENRYRGDYYVLPKEGTVHMLVIPIWFTNSTSFFKVDQKQEILTDLEYVFNTYRSEDGYHSVKQFYEEESNGKVTLNITISEFYESGTSSKVYGDTVEADINNTYTLADQAITWYFTNHTNESISDYDANKDGLVDAVSLVYAANYYGTYGDQNGTVAFQFKNTSSTSGHKYNNGSFSPIGGIYGFNKKDGTPEGLSATDLSKYYPSYFFESGCKTIIHETGHMFGFEDLYEDNHAVNKYYPAGRFNMQSSDYGGHDPYQMNLVGWSKPQIYSASNYEVGEKVVVNISDFATSGNNILLTREMNEYNSLFDEYMLLELFAPTGLNKYDAKNSVFKFNEPGIRLWHVNSILENMSASGKETSQITDNNWINLKYSNNDQSSKYDLAHWIRNNPEENYDTVSTVTNSYGLFKSGDHFDMNTYQSQFVNKDKLDNKEKLGWEFNVDTIYQSVDNVYGAVITLTRVDNTRTDFDYEARVNKDIATQPTEDGIDLTNVLFGDDELFSLIYNFNNAVPPSYYVQGKPISYKGLCLFASSDGNGGSLVISIKDKDGYRVYINTVSITYSVLTNVRPTALVDGNEVTGTSFEGPYNEIDTYNEVGKTYEVNSSSITIQNKFNGTLNHFSVLAIYSVAINYHVEKI